MRVSTHSRPKAAGLFGFQGQADFWFQHTAARRRLVIRAVLSTLKILFQHTAARRRLVLSRFCQTPEGQVSTHSRPKAAGWRRLKPSRRQLQFQHTAARRRLAQEAAEKAAVAKFQHTAARRRLVRHSLIFRQPRRFNTQPPEGGWRLKGVYVENESWVSTHSRPKAAGLFTSALHRYGRVSTHSRPKAAGLLPPFRIALIIVSTHSRPKAAGSLFHVFSSVT